MNLFLTNNRKIPRRYIPKTLSISDAKKQRKYLEKSRKAYKKGEYLARPKVTSFHSKKSNHVMNAKTMYNVDTITPNSKLSKATRCTKKALEKIINKGRGAFYSSGSRPNQTAESWGRARLASSITGGPASKVDYNILQEGCTPSSKALKIAIKPNSIL